MNKKFFPANIWQALLTFLIPIFCLAPLLLLISGHLSKDEESILFFVLIGFLASLFVYLINRKRKIRMHYTFRWPNKQWVLLFLGFVIIFEIGINNPLLRITSDFLNISTSSDYSFLFIFGAVLIGPVIEEVLFRGIILKGFLLNYSPTVAILLSAILFSLAHVQPTQLFGAFVIGLFLAWIFYKTENLILVIFLHSLANITSLLSNYLPSSPYFIPFSILILLFLFRRFRMEQLEKDIVGTSIIEIESTKAGN